jgi:hypothetical protein
MPMLSNNPTMTRSALLESLHATEREVAGFFGSLTAEKFTLRVDSAWTPAEHLDHLNIAVSAVARGFSMSRWLLLIRFGWARRPSRTYQQLRDDYRAKLAAGAVARGGFVPKRLELNRDETLARQIELLARWHRVNARLSTALQKWSERELERIRLPHPLLGKITATEMIFFTIYHGQHHIAAAKSRLP